MFRKTRFLVCFLFSFFLRIVWYNFWGILSMIRSSSLCILLKFHFESNFSQGQLWSCNIMTFHLSLSLKMTIAKMFGYFKFLTFISSTCSFLRDSSSIYKISRLIFLSFDCFSNRWDVINCSGLFLVVCFWIFPS